MPFRDYVVASWAGMLPGTFAYVYAGSVGKAAVAAAGEASGSGDFEHVKVLLWGKCGLLALMISLKKWHVHHRVKGGMRSSNRTHASI